jgi:hypothetical protein
VAARDNFLNGAIFVNGIRNNAELMRSKGPLLFCVYLFIKSVSAKDNIESGIFGGDNNFAGTMLLVLAKWKGVWPLVFCSFTCWYLIYSLDFWAAILCEDGGIYCFRFLSTRLCHLKTSGW